MQLLNTQRRKQSQRLFSKHNFTNYNGRLCHWKSALIIYATHKKQWWRVFHQLWLEIVSLKVHQLNMQRTKVKCFHSIAKKCIYYIFSNFESMRWFPTTKTKTTATPTFTTSAPETTTKMLWTSQKMRFMWDPISNQKKENIRL